MIGERKGHLVTEKPIIDDAGNIYWKCRCDCGCSIVLSLQEYMQPVKADRTCGVCREMNGAWAPTADFLARLDNFRKKYFGEKYV